MSAIDSNTYTGENCGIPLDLAWVESSRINLPALVRRAESHLTRRSIKKEWQAAWLLRAVSCIDLTTLDGDDTPGNVNRFVSTFSHLQLSVYRFTPLDSASRRGIR